MAFDYTDLATTATELIADFGRSLTLTQKGSTATTAGKPWEGGTPSSADPITITGVFRKSSDAFRNDDRVRSTDRVCLIDCAVEPKEGDKVTDDGTVLEVVAVQEIKPGDTALAYRVALRG